MVPPEQFEVIKQQFVEHLQREHLQQLAMQAQVLNCLPECHVLEMTGQLWATCSMCKHPVWLEALLLVSMQLLSSSSDQALDWYSTSDVLCVRADCAAVR